MAKEQKAIAKFLDKDGITVDFWRFPIKNVDKIIGQVLEMVGKSRLGLSKDDLKNFDTFVIQTTEPNGTVIDTVFECSDVEFLDLVKEDYKDYFGYYPSEDKFDSEKWSYILSGHKGYKESKKSAKKSLKERYEYKVDEITDIIRSNGVLFDSCNILDDYAWNIEHGKTTWLSKHAYDEISIAYANCVQYLRDEYNGKKKDELIDDLTKFFDKVIALTESKKCTKKSLKEKLNDNGDVKFNDIYSCDLVNVLTVTVYDKELYEKLREEDLVLYQKGVYEQIDWKSFQDEISYLRDDIYASEDFNVIFALYEGALLVYVRDNTDDDTIMMYKLESKFAN